jgi:hypothetical protein
LGARADAAADRKGRELFRTGALYLVFRCSDRRWEYRRTLSRLAPDSGWTHVSSWFPFQYYKRAVG